MLAKWSVRAYRYRVIWIALAIVASALIVRHELQRLVRVLTTLTAIIGVLAERAAEKQGQGPVLSQYDVDRIRRM